VRGPEQPSARLADLLFELEAPLDDVADIEIAVGPHPTDRVDVLRQQIEIFLCQRLIGGHGERIELRQAPET
jgi:hypothetical protein